MDAALGALLFIGFLVVTVQAVITSEGFKSGGWTLLAGGFVVLAVGVLALALAPWVPWLATPMFQRLTRLAAVVFFSAGFHTLRKDQLDLRRWKRPVAAERPSGQQPTVYWEERFDGIGKKLDELLERLRSNDVR